MRFETLGEKQNGAVLFFHAMGVTGESSEPVAQCLKDRYFCILPTSTVYCAGQKYTGKADEVRQVENFLRNHGVTRLKLVAASSIGADLAVAFLTQTALPVEHVFFDGGQFAQIGKATRRVYFSFGSAEDHFKYRPAVKSAYPHAHFPVFKGCDHMQYQIQDPQGFAGMLVSLMEEDRLPASLGAAEEKE